MTKPGSKKDAKDSRSAGSRRQVAALPFRLSKSAGIEILLITSRDTHRAVIPKGWPMKGLTDPDAAAREALEEAGIVGKVSRKPVGSFEYWKRLASTFEFVTVDVYPLEVKRQRKSWPEKGDRQFAWFAREDAALLVDEPALSTLIRTFTTRSKTG